MIVLVRPTKGDDLVILNDPDISIGMDKDGVYHFIAHSNHAYVNDELPRDIAIPLANKLYNTCGENIEMMRFDIKNIVDEYYKKEAKNGR